MNENKLKLTFCSGAGTVTGSNFLLEGNEKKFLVDCGLLQGEIEDNLNWQDFPYDPSTIDILFITHAHIDHIGRIPKIINDGFKGKIYSTTPTKDIAEVMLADTAHLLSKDTANGLDKIYTAENIKKAMSLWHTLDYGERLNVDHGFQFSYKDAGHILGSGMLQVIYNGKKIVFTGDLGNSPSPILKNTDKLTDADYLIMESVYGDRNHEDRNERQHLLEKVIKDNYQRKGTLMIPVFSLERTQELLYEINEMAESKRILRMPIFLDSPLAIKLTYLFKKYEKYFNEKALKIIQGGDDVFNFVGLNFSDSTDQSKSIIRVPGPKVIMAGSGMSNGGRIIHHEKNYLGDKNNTLLLIGYQSVGTLGRAILDGVKKVRILGEDVPIKAKIETISGYSGHKDSDHLIDFVSTTAQTLDKVFIVMGEPKSSMYLAQKLKDNLNVNCVVPETGEEIIIEC